MLSSLQIFALVVGFLSSFALGNGEKDLLNGKLKDFPFDTPSIGNGLPLPQPKVWMTTGNVFAVRNEGFIFNATGYTCDDLEAAFDRFYKMIFDVPENYRHGSKPKPVHKRVRDSSEINGLEVMVHQACDGKPMPALGMSEIYKLSVVSGRAVLSADTLWGALRGLETFSQIVYETDYESHGLWLVNETTIEDGPRFAHRGVLVDTSRHFVEKNILLQFISAMSMVKFNVFHWHIVDSQSFPYRSRVFPDLSHRGAYEPYTHTYTHEDIAEVIEYARQRGIRVLAEFDTPGHTLSWGLGAPGLLTPCYGSDGKPDGTYGPIDPSKNETYDFLEKLFTEVAGVFPEQYMHLGGDEVSFTCWQSNPDITAFMKKMGFTTYAEVESYYIKRVVDIVGKIGKHYVVWQEPFDNGVKLANETVVNIWKWFGGRSPEQEVAAVTKAGFKAITSACWYLNIISYGSNWEKYYKCDPQNFTGTTEQKELVQGGEACMWGEFVDGTNLMTRTWPRASVVAERLWSPQSVTDVGSMTARLEQHRCRMIKRSLDAEPENPSFCRYEKQAAPPLY